MVARPPERGVGSRRVVDGPFEREVGRRSVADRAHQGDIEGALGRIGVADVGARRSSRARLAALLAVVGPGVVVLVAGNDAGGIATYAEAGQNHGFGLVWALLLLAPVLFVNQEMAARLGAVTGVGHARLIAARIGSGWGRFVVGDLLVLNLVLLVTQLVGVVVAADRLGVPRVVAVLLVGGALVGLTASGSFRRWERVMWVLVALNVAIVALAIAAVGGHHPATARVLARAPRAESGLLLLALVGTTIAPWQLFLHQSNVVDKRITPRWMTQLRADTGLGVGLMVLGGATIVVLCAVAFGGTSLAGRYSGPSGVVAGLDVVAGPTAGLLFALVLLNASMLGAAAVTLASSYAVGDLLGYRHSLHRPWRQAPVFHGTFALTVALAALLVLIPGLPLGRLTTIAQLLAALLLPCSVVFLIVLGNDAALLGPWRNGRLGNAAAVAGATAVLAVSSASAVSAISDDRLLIAIVGGLAALGGAIGGVALVRDAGGRTPPPNDARRAFWTSPPLEQLPRPPRSRARDAAILAMRGYLAALAVVIVVVVLR